MIDQQANYSMKSRKQAGNAIVEYVLPALALVCVCATGLSAFGSNLNNLVGSTNNNMKQQFSNTQKAQITHTLAKSNFLIQQQQSASQNGSATLNTNPVCSGSTCTTLLDLNASIVTTTGTNGQVAQIASQAADIFGQIAQQLSAQNADPSLIALITQLANNGHIIANGEQDMGADGWDNFYNGVNEFQAGKANFEQLSQQLGSVITLLPIDSQVEIAKASAVITTIANNYNFTVVQPGKVAWSYTPNNADLTNINANTICANGGDTSKCTTTASNAQ